MGIPHLYTHLRPHARAETFPARAPAPLFIDGPGLAHHVYQMALSSTPAGANPWDAAVGYAAFQQALVRYLDELGAAGLDIRKIYFDGRLPASKVPTRHSRLDDALRRLRAYHSQHAHSLRSGSSSSPAPTATGTAFTPAAVYTPHRAPLSAPPFILSAALAALAAHATYAPTVATVPAEAESYCARDAIAASGLVLTGDSDLLLFAPPPSASPSAAAASSWGVLMFRDVTLLHPGVTAAVFRPVELARTLGVDLAFLGYLAASDPHATISVLRARVARIDARQRSGVVVGERGRAWREFRALYQLPAAGDGGGGGAGVEPRIAELLNGGAAMFLPFLWEDPARGSAWDAGRATRAAAYALLGRDGVGEVCRRGQRVSDAFVRAGDAAAALARVGAGEGDWWCRVVLEDVVGVYEERGQAPPERGLLEGVAYMLAPAASRAAVQTPALRGSSRWTWERVQVFAMAQAAWYSLLVLKEVLAARGSGDCGDRFESFPGAAECIDGGWFLEGAAGAGEREKRVVAAVMAAYHGRVASADGAEGADTGNGNGKRSSSRELRAGAKGEKRKKRGKDKKKKKKEEEGEGEGEGPLDGGNVFAVLAD